MSRSNREGFWSDVGSVSDRMSLCGLLPEGSSLVGLVVVTILGFHCYAQLTRTRGSRFSGQTDSVEAG